MTDFFKKNLPLSIIVAGVLIAVAILFAGEGILGTRGEVSVEKASEKAINYINENLLMAGLTSSLIDKVDEGSVYRIRLEVKEEGDVLGEIDSYVSKDGKFLFPEAYDMNKPLEQQEEETETPSEEPNEETGEMEEEGTSLSPENSAEFVSCLKDAGFVIYGAEWCGWTSQLVTTLGGQEAVESIYVECSEEEDVCLEKEIVAYPTILINGEEFVQDRTVEAFSEATGCSLPVNL